MVYRIWVLCVQLYCGPCVQGDTTEMGVGIELAHSILNHFYFVTLTHTWTHTYIIIIKWAGLSLVSNQIYTHTVLTHTAHTHSAHTHSTHTQHTHMHTHTCMHTHSTHTCTYTHLHAHTQYTHMHIHTHTHTNRGLCGSFSVNSYRYQQAIHVHGLICNMCLSPNHQAVLLVKYLCNCVGCAYLYKGILLPCSTAVRFRQD